MKKSLITFAILAVCALPIWAQSAPEPINAAYADLSERVGVTLNTTNTNWRWEQAVYDDSSLGCPQAVTEVTPGQVVAYRFILTYAGTTYDYRVSNDQTIVVLCQQYPEGQPPLTPEEEAELYSNTLCPAPEVGAPRYLRSRIAPDTQAQASPNAGVNNLRDAPAITANLITAIPTGAVYQVMREIECDDEGTVWWRVDFDGVQGWVAESYQGDYLVQPFTPRPLPVSLMSITPENSNVQEVSRLQGNLTAHFAFSPDGRTLAVAGARGAEGVWFYDMGDVTALPRLVEVDLNITDLTFFPDGERVLVATLEGGAHILDVRPQATLIERLYLNSFEQFAQFATLDPTAERFAIAGQNAATTATVPRENAIIVWQLDNITQGAVLHGATGMVSQGRFAPDGVRFMAIDSSGAFHVFDASSTSRPVQTIEGRHSALAFSPNGQFFALGDLNASITLHDATTLERITALTGSLGFINDMAFSPDSRLIGAVGTDGVLRLWNTQSDEALVALDTGMSNPARLVFSPDGTLIAVAGDDGTLRLFAVVSTP